MHEQLTPPHYLVTTNLLYLLTRRERDVLRLAAEGLYCKEIADRLGIRPCTVEEYRKSALAKFGLQGKAGLRQLLLLLAPYWPQTPNL